MAFSTQRGRPRKVAPPIDIGTPELRLKHALRLTAEPIDLCLEKQLINQEQHWCGLHLRWLYTLRYGAPSLTTHYTDHASPASGEIKQDTTWRTLREQEYQTAIQLLKTHHHYERVMRLAVYNELPAFLSPPLLTRARSEHALAQQLTSERNALCKGLTLLARSWRPGTRGAGTTIP